MLKKDKKKIRRSTKGDHNKCIETHIDIAEERMFANL